MENAEEQENRRNKQLRLLLIAVLLIALAAVTIYFVMCAGESPVSETTAAGDTPSPVSALADSSGLLVCFLDVGQGDCTFLRAPDGTTMLIDAGPSGSFDTIRAFLDTLGVARIDLVVASHLHSDHIGSMAEVIRAYDVGAFYMTPYDFESSLYVDLLAALDERGVPVNTISAGADTLLPWNEEAEVRVLSPYDVEYTDYNDTSMILRVKYGETAVMLVGDAGELAERLTVKAQKNVYLHANLLKIGHHGSADGTSQKFLNAVNPSIAVISVGSGNEYDLPSQTVLDRLDAMGITIYRTDRDGSICFTLDGTNVWVIE